MLSGEVVPVATVTTFNIALLASTTRFVSAINQAERRWNQFARSVERHARTMPKAIREATAPSLALGRQVAKATAVVGAALSGMAGLGVRLAAEYEQTTIAFETLLGSAEAADQFLRRLDTYAAATPFNVDQLRAAARQLLAYGFAAERIYDMLTPIGDAVAAMGGSQEVMERVIRAIGQVQTKGRVMGEEMLQLTEAGIPAWRYLAEAMGTSIQQVMEASRKGAIDARTAIQAILKGLEQDFGGAMERQSKTILGQWERIKEGLTIITRGMGQDVIRVFGLQRGMERLAGAVSRFAQAVAESGSLLHGLRAAFPPWLPYVIAGTAGAITGALVPAITAALIPALRRLWQSLGLTVGALRLWAVVGAVVAVAAWYLATNWDRAGSFVLRALANWATAFIQWNALVLKAIAWLLSHIPLIGGALARPFAAGAEAMDRFVRRVVDWAGSLGKVRASMGSLRQLERVPQNLGKGTERLADAAQRAADAQDKLAKGLKSAGKAAADNLQSFDEVHRVQDEMAGGAGALDLPAIDLYADWADLMDEVAGGIGNIGAVMESLARDVGGPAQTIGSWWERLKQWAIEAWEAIRRRLIEIWDGIKQKAGTAWQSITNAILGPIQEQWQRITGTWDRLRTWLGDTWAAIRTTAASRWAEITAPIRTWIDSQWQKVTGTWENLRVWLGQLWAMIWQAAQERWAGITTTIGTWVDQGRIKIGTTWQSIQTGLGATWEAIRTTAAQRWQDITTAIMSRTNTARQHLETAWAAARNGLGAVWDTIVSWAGERWGAVASTVAHWTDIARQRLATAWDAVRNKLGNTWESIRATAADVWGRIQQVVRNAVNGVIGYVNRFIRAINNIRISLPTINIPLVGTVGGWTIQFAHIPEIPYLARGGDIVGAGLAVVGEAGPELLSLPRGARVTPLSGGGDIEDAVYRAVYQAMYDVLSERAAEADQAPEIVLRVDGRTLARAVLPSVISEGQRQGLNLVVRPQGV